MKNKWILFSVLYFFLSGSIAQESKEQYEFKMPGKDLLKRIEGLPDPFLKHDGTRVESIQEWPEQRQYIKSMLEYYQYGTTPPIPKNIIVKETLSEPLYDGLAIKKQYTLTINHHEKTLDLNFGLIKPQGEGPFPIIIKNDRYINDIPDEINLEAINRGYIMCQFVRTDLGSDHSGIKNRSENHNNGVFLLYPEYDWGTIAAWAWGYSLIIDFLEKQSFIDATKIIATGHSRGGKTALCAGIYDERIAVTAPNSSGLGGTASHRYFELGMLEQKIGMHINSHSHWWTDRYYMLAGFETMIPFDSHFAKAVIAPRALINPHALQDYHANPFGTHLTHEAAKKVFRWLNVEDNIAMHWRTGAHDQGVIDWLALMDFCDKYFYNKKVMSRFDILPYPTVKPPIFWDLP